MNRERVIVTGGREWGHARPDAHESRIRIAKGERDFVSETLHRELRVATAWAFVRLLVVVGDCPTGVDAIVRSCCETWGLHFKVYEANWREEGKRAGPVRNGRMVADGAIRCLAFAGGYGTGNCIKQARAAGIPVTDFST